eukprot:11755314-Karenia_brevis.AAC.1
MGLAAAWNARSPTKRLKRGDHLAEVNGRSATGISDLSTLCSGTGTDVFTFQRCCPNAQQFDIIARIASRLQQEWLEERA